MYCFLKVCLLSYFISTGEKNLKSKQVMVLSFVIWMLTVKCRNSWELCSVVMQSL